MPYNILLLSSRGFGLYWEKPFSTSRVVGRQMAKTVCVCVCVGGGGGGARHYNFPFETHLLHCPLMTSNFLHLSLSTLHSGFYFITRELIPSSSLIKIKKVPPLPLNKPLSLLSFTSNVFEVNNHTVGEGGVNKGFMVYIKEPT